MGGSRRSLLATAFCAAINVPTGARAAPLAIAQLRDLEERYGGRLGVNALDTGTQRRLAYRAEERFPICSTFKWLAAAAILRRVDQGEERLERHLPYGASDLVEYTPVAAAQLTRGGLTVGDACTAAIEWSDNTAANLLLRELGGPAGLTRCLRTLGDTVTRLDRIEPALNVSAPGDPRDTTSPAAMMRDMQAILLGTALSTAARERLLGWLVANRTGNDRLRAGLPRTWRVGDKTGTWSAQGSTNDVAIAWPPHRPPILIACYYTGSSAPPRALDAVVAGVGQIVAGTFAGG